MHGSNFREWEALRAEVETIRKCITNYMGLLFGGVGFAFVALGSRTQEVLSVQGDASTLVPLGSRHLRSGL